MAISVFTWVMMVTLWFSSGIGGEQLIIMACRYEGILCCDFCSDDIQKYFIPFILAGPISLLIGINFLLVMVFIVKPILNPCSTFDPSRICFLGSHIKGTRCNQIVSGEGEAERV